jgi:hypothetical protein
MMKTITTMIIARRYSVFIRTFAIADRIAHLTGNNEQMRLASSILSFLPSLMQWSSSRHPRSS